MADYRLEIWGEQQLLQERPMTQPQPQPEGLETSQSITGATSLQKLKNAELDDHR